MDLSEYRYIQYDYDTYDNDDGVAFRKKTTKRLVYIAKNFDSYERAMNTLSVLAYVHTSELNHVFYYITRISTKLLMIEIESIIDQLKKNLPENEISIEYNFKVINKFYVQLTQQLEHIKKVKDEILLTGFISHDVMMNVLFEYISYKKLMIYFCLYS